ncbi:hypothetical protein C8R44DRAFT_767858 [Mycena epipterygia]|nr:hypothetical protein C8R44DRAFT_767858 [Mycena epipterygia]
MRPFKSADKFWPFIQLMPILSTVLQLHCSPGLNSGVIQQMLMKTSNFTEQH